MIRIRHPTGTSSFPLSPSSTLSGLQTYIESQCGIAPNDQELKLGYPPAALALDKIGSDTLLSDPSVGIKRGEQVIVARRSGSSSVAAPPTSAQHSTSSFGALGGPKANISTATGGAGYGLGARRLGDGLSARSAPFPSSSSSASKPGKVEDGFSLPLPSGGHLSLKVVPDDNSCLFASVSYLFNHTFSPSHCSSLRSIVASHIRSHPDLFPEVVLGQPPSVYISKILSPTTWGGGIELAILAEHFQTEICSIDVASGVIHRFGEDRSYSQRGIVVYSGIHYDALSLKEGSGEKTLFPNVPGVEEEEDELLQAARKLCEELKRRKYYTDTSSFTLKCGQCGERLRGEKEALGHARQTGHGEFGEV